METRGAGIVVQGELLQLLRNNGASRLPATSCRMRRYLNPEGGDGKTQPMPQDFTSWEAIYRTLRAAFPEQRYHMGTAITRVDDAHDGMPVSADVEGRGRIEADVLVSADGAQSLTRRRLLPDVASRYAGYVAWRAAPPLDVSCASNLLDVEWLSGKGKVVRLTE
jgi:2-polyprenyl-6-methoxyphenol hydroxylase-like FAD-dependent oxidoreductase